MIIQYQELGIGVRNVSSRAEHKAEENLYVKKWAKQPILIPFSIKTFYVYIVYMGGSYSQGGSQFPIGGRRIPPPTLLSPQMKLW